MRACRDVYCYRSLWKTSKPFLAETSAAVIVLERPSKLTTYSHHLYVSPLMLC
jgi:hypothetical protein